jgi:hypothetical protein
MSLEHMCPVSLGNFLEILASHATYAKTGTLSRPAASHSSSLHVTCIIFEGKLHHCLLFKFVIRIGKVEFIKIRQSSHP